MKGEIEFSEQAQHAIELAQKPDKNLFITGKAGTGKSTLLEHIRMMPDRKMIVLAPTGIAAINVKGETIHSFFKLKPGYELDEATRKRIDPEKTKGYKSIKTILIDEISMVRADLLDAMDIFLRRARESDEPFGGVQMIFFGDLFQLPPVLTNDDKAKYYAEYESPYFFSAQVFHQRNLFNEAFRLEHIELTHIYRQSDEKFIRLLNAIRDNSATEQDLTALNQRVHSDYIPPDDEPCVHLMATNANANAYNLLKLGQLQTPPIEFQAEKKGKLGNLQPNDTTITVKVGAQVMFINNDVKRQWVNGTIGTVTFHTQKYDDEVEDLVDVLEVTLEDDTVVEVKPHTWDISKYSLKDGGFVREEIGSFTQMPLKLAWAITIHKSQGKTFEQVVIDLGWGSFTHGQTYVALSRCTSLDGLVLKQPLRPTDIIVDEYVCRFARGDM